VRATEDHLNMVREAVIEAARALSAGLDERVVPADRERVPSQRPA